MADQLKINRCWFHANSKYPHYDIPKKMVDSVLARCTIVSTREILQIILGSDQKVVKNEEEET